MDDILTSGLTVYLPLWKRDGVTIRSDEGFGHICTPAATTTWTPMGRLLSTSGNIAIPRAQTNLFTFIAWVKLNALPVANAYVYFSDNNGYSWMKVDNNGAVVCDTFDTGSHPYSTANGLITAGNWYMLANMVDIASDVRQIYINAFLYKNDTTNIANMGALENWMLGFTATSLNGLMGDVMIYEKRLYEPEIHGIYLATKDKYR